MLGALSSEFLFVDYPGMFGYLVCVLSCVTVINIPGFCFVLFFSFSGCRPGPGNSDTFLTGKFLVSASTREIFWCLLGLKN